MGKTIDDPQTPAQQTGDLLARIEALERTAWRPVVGMGYPWFGTEPASYTGEVEVKPGFLLCNGAEVSAADWPELFAAIGLLYDPTPSQSGLFALPAAVGRSLFGKATSGTLSNIGAIGGAESVTLTEAQLPAHDHSIGGSGSHTHLQDKPGGGTWEANGGSENPISGSQGATGSGGEHNHGGNTGNAGSGSAHANLPPYVVVTAWTIYAGRKVPVS